MYVNIGVIECEGINHLCKRILVAVVNLQFAVALVKNRAHLILFLVTSRNKLIVSWFHKYVNLVKHNSMFKHIWMPTYAMIVFSHHAGIFD